MRELKFRAWDKKKKTMVATGFHIIGEVTVFDMLRGYKIEEYTNFIIMQYTGLKDKNGKEEIYEGDIVRFFQKEWGLTYIAVVKFGEWTCNCGDYYCYEEGRGWYLEGKHWYERPENRHEETRIESIISKKSGLEVIGNLYENPELLKEKV